MAALGGNVKGQLAFTAQITLDAQNDYQPDKLVLKGNAAYTGSISAQALLEGDDLDDLAGELEKVTLSASEGQGQGLEVSGELDLKDQENLDATLRALTSQGQDVLPLVTALDENGKLGFDTYDLETSETEGEIKVGVGHRRRRRRQVQQRDAERPHAAWSACPAAASSRACASSRHPDARD